MQKHERIAPLADEERRRLLETWNDTATPYPQERCIHELFEAQVDRTPQATAVECEGQSLSYAELNVRANELAHHLRTLGVGPEQLVAICVERSLSMVIGLLAVLKAGGAYVPLDPGYPSGRLSHMLADSAPVVVLSHATALAVLRSAIEELRNAPPILNLDDTVPWAQQPGSNLAPGSVGVTGRNVAYVIYTSGSTGKPKGVMTEHHALVNRLCWMQSAYQLDGSDAVIQKTPFSFDVSVWEFLWPLVSGARLVMAKPEGHRDPLYLRRLIQERRITTAHFVPSMLQLFLSAPGVSSCTFLRRVVCSGEALSASILQRFEKTLPQAHLYNLYGPTEAAIDVTAWAWCGQPPQDTRAPPIGRPIWNIRIYILDSRFEPVPVGADGELYIAGVGVARGYANRPELTAERFLPNPFVAGDRMYKTGDLARYLPDGNIAYLGRNDFQVKINGNRIELGEIETRLLQHPRVREAVVVAREDRPGDPRLIAYYSLDDEADLPVEDLKAHLSATLARYMIPAAYVRLPSLPLSVNGKLDRKALPTPGRDAYDTRVGVYQAEVR